MVPETGDRHIGEDLIIKSLSRLGEFPTIAPGPQRVQLQPRSGCYDEKE